MEFIVDAVGVALMAWVGKMVIWLCIAMPILAVCGILIWRSKKR